MSIKEIPLIINGEKVRSTTNEWLDVLNPATQEVVARVPMATSEEVNAAVTCAQEAFKSWSKVSLTNRMHVMVKFAHLVRENTKELAELVTLEHGKTLPDAEGEVGRALEAIENACSITRLQLGDMGNNVATYEDDDMRFELVGERSVRLWMGDVNKKVMIVNMGVTIADQ